MTKNILVIDDDEILRKSLAKGLRAADFDVILSQSAQEATEILNRITVDAIVLDRMMTGLDGLSFLKQLRSRGNTIPVIMLTAMSGPENTIDGLREGADDYMSKPFQLQELILRLNKIIKNHPDPNKDSFTRGLMFTDGEFFIADNNGNKKLISLSCEEKKLLQQLTEPVGNIVPGTPMVVKRLRNKINSVLSDIDIITVRGMGYKIINSKKQ